MSIDSFQDVPGIVKNYVESSAVPPDFTGDKETLLHHLAIRHGQAMLPLLWPILLDAADAEPMFLLPQANYKTEAQCNEFTRMLDVHADAVFALACLDCNAYREPILASLRRLEGEHFFNEYFPLLAVGVQDEEIDDLLERIGNKASKDCVCGILLALALRGARNRSRYLALLSAPFRSSWEVWDPDTGARLAYCVGCIVLGITQADLEEVHWQYPQNFSENSLGIILDRFRRVLKSTSMGHERLVLQRLAPAGVLQPYTEDEDDPS